MRATRIRVQSRRSQRGPAASFRRWPGRCLGATLIVALAAACGAPDGESGSPQANPSTPEMRSAEPADSPRV